ncbi:MAG: hypothetical protein ILM98_04175 [Kiritimatiellae bacterium]|nr:hypothetical protein [Kiritimatiellia bacterium]
MNISWYIKDITTQYGLQDYGAEKKHRHHDDGNDRIEMGLAAGSVDFAGFAKIARPLAIIPHRSLVKNQHHNPLFY